MNSSRKICIFAVFSVVAMNLGCSSFWHELKPHRLQKWNSGPAPSLDPEFSFRNRSLDRHFARKNPVKSEAEILINSNEVVTVRSQSPQK